MQRRQDCEDSRHCQHEGSAGRIERPVPDQDPEHEDHTTRAVADRKRSHQLPLRSSRGHPQGREQRQKDKPEGDHDRRDGGIGQVERAGESSDRAEDQDGAEHGLEIAAVVARIEERERAMAAAWTDEPGGTSPSRIMRRYWDEWCLPDELAPYHRLFYEIYALSLQQPERFPQFLERGAIPWLPFLRDLVQQSGLPEAEANVIATLMASTVMGALLVLLGSSDQETATRAVYAAADSIEALIPRRQESSDAEPKDEQHAD